jgi:hypothetical protein
MPLKQGKYLCLEYMKFIKKFDRQFELHQIEIGFFPGKFLKMPI